MSGPGAARRRLGPAAIPVGAALLAVALLCGVVLTASRKADATSQAEAQARVQSNRDAAVRALVAQAEDYRQSVSAWASTEVVVASLTTRSAATLQAADRLLATLADSKQSPAAFVSDVAGSNVAIYPRQPQLIGKNFAFRDWFKGVSRTGRPYVSEGYRSAAAGRPLVVAVSAPVRSKDQVVGFVTVLWQLASVRDVSDGSQHDDGVTLTVTDQRGQALTGELVVDERGQPRVTTVSARTRQALNGVSTVGVERGGSVDREGSSGDAFIAAGPVPSLGWTVTATLPAEWALGAASSFQRSLKVTLVVALLLLCLITLGAVVIARRRHAERAIADDERRRLTTLFASSPIGILEGLPDGTFLAVNPAMTTMLGYSREELLALNALDLHDPERVAPVQQLLADVQAGESNGYTAERVYRAKDGSAVPVLVHLVALGERVGGQRKMVGFVVDQREQAAAADALQVLATALAEREAFLSILIDTMDIAVLACDVNGDITRVNPQVRTLHGLSADTPLDAPGALTITELDGSPITRERSPLHRALLEGEVRDAEHLIVTADGRSPRRMISRGRRMVGRDGETIGAVVAAHDVTAMRVAEEALRASEDRFRRVFDEGLAGTALVAADGSLLRVNATLAQLLGRTVRAFTGLPVSTLFEDRTDHRRIDELLRRGAGELRTEMAMVSDEGRPLWGLVALSWITEYDGQRVLLVQVEDITARRRAERRLTELALHDELTGLPNRRLLLERCEASFAKASSTGGKVTVLFIDLDGFKPINDRAGHDLGDQVLTDVAHDLRAMLRPTDTVARVGGDEFVVLVDAADESDATGLAERIATTIRRQVTTGDASLLLSASIGIATVDLAHEPDVRPDQLLRRADAAMYRAKEQGRDRHDVFDAELKARTEIRQHLEQAMRDGLRHDRVSLVFQPVLEIDTGAILGAEALMRLRDSNGEVLPTLPAILAAEAAGLSEALGDRVLELALSAASTWPDRMTIAVNISARELTGKDLRARVERALDRHRFDPRRLVLEITETSMLSAGPSALVELEGLRDRGVRVAIDDFGTAYATLQNLTTLPVDALKVDASFTAGLPDQRAHTAVVHGIASMARELGIPCIVEGVETEVQHAALRGLGVQAQGWLWGRPRGADEVPSLRMVPPQRVQVQAG